MNILITGGRGYIAQSVYDKLKNNHDVTSINRSTFDLTDREKTNEWFCDKYFDVVIHTAIDGGSRLKTETSSVLDNNLQMYYNLLNNKNHYEKFINFGSGAELYNLSTFYGLSKHVIRTSLLHIPNFYNIRIFAVFDENELDTRFIKSNLLRYINGENMIIHQDKNMDFFYMKDLVEVVEHYVNTETLPKEFNCTYMETNSLSQIVNKINNLSDRKVGVEIKSIYNSKDYVGWVTPLDVNFFGLDLGIQNVYNKLICKT